MKIENNRGLSFLRVIPKFDSEVFTLKSVENGSVISRMSKLNGSYIWQSSENSTENGTIATFTFEINEGAAFDSYEIGLLVVDAFGKAISDLEVTGANSPLNVIEHEYGDCSGDGKISSLDVIELRKYIASYDYENGVAGSEICDGADADGDGYVTATDLTAIRKYLANYDYDSGTPNSSLGRQ